MIMADWPPRSPTKKLTMSLLSASSAVYVHTSPAPSGAAVAVGTFLVLAKQKLQILSIWTCSDFTPNSNSSDHDGGSNDIAGALLSSRAFRHQNSASSS
jgi:hypothetical protein